MLSEPLVCLKDTQDQDTIKITLVKINNASSNPIPLQYVTSHYEHLMRDWDNI